VDVGKSFQIHGTDKLSRGFFYSIKRAIKGGRMGAASHSNKLTSLKDAEHRKIILRVSIVTIIVNVALMLSKGVLGVVFNNLSVISDAIHSASDVFTSFLIVIAVFLSSPKRDKKHNYGREKVEPLFVLALAIVLGSVGVMLGVGGIQGIISPKEAQFNVALVTVVILSIIVKEAMFWYEIYYAKRLKSEMLRADAWHSRSDSLSSVAVLIGLICSTFLKTNIVESIAVIIVAVMILKVAFDIMKPAINQLTDKAAGEDITNRIRDITMQIEGVQAVDLLRTRIFGSRIFVDIEIAVDKDLSVEKSHGIAQAVHDTLEADDGLRIKHCLVHVNPYDGELGG
jgi:cation diffusion facilitator family transporter